MGTQGLCPGLLGPQPGLQPGPKLSNSSAKLQTAWRQPRLRLRVTSKKTLGCLAVLPLPAAVATLGTGHGKPWSSGHPRPPAASLAVPASSGPWLPSIMRRWGPAPRLLPQPRICLEVSGPRSEAEEAGGGQEETNDSRRSRWAAPGPGRGLPLLSEPPSQPGALTTPQSARCTSTPSFPRAVGVGP